MADKFSLKAVISASAGGMLKTLKQVNQATRTTRKYIGDMGSSANNLAGKVGLPIGLISTALAGFSLVGLKNTVMGFAALGDEVAKSAQRLGVSIPEYQRLKYIAGQSGVGPEELASSVGRLNRNIAMAATGKGKELASLMKRAGISMRGANGELRSGADLLPEVADLFARNGNAAVQARMGNAIFGKSWMALAPLLQGGRAGIDELTARYKMLGIEIDESAIKQGEAFGDQVEDLGHAVSAYGNQIASKLLPVLSPMIERTIQWAAANRELITTRVSSFIAEIGRYMASIDWNAVVQGANSLVKEVRDLVDFVGGARNALIGLVVFMNLGAIVAALGLAGSILRVTWALGLMAVTSVPAAIAAVSSLGATMGLAGASASTLLLLLGKIAAVGAAGFVGWEIGKRLNDWAINPLAKMMTGDKDATLGTALYDMFNKDPMADQNRPSIAAPGGRGRDDKLLVEFVNAPAGMQVQQRHSGSTPPAEVNVGRSSASLGLP